jgi:hypothetical protein
MEGGTGDANIVVWEESTNIVGQDSLGGGEHKNHHQ